MVTIEIPESTEPLPWKADISAHDMEILVWSRLPKPTSIDDVLKVFGIKVIIGDEWLQLQTNGKSHWTWVGLAESWWVTKFFFDTSNMITHIEASHRSDL